MVGAADSMRADAANQLTRDAGILIDPVGVYRGPAASTKAMAGWIGAGLSGATIVMGPYPLLPYRAAALVDYDFSLLSDDAPLTKHTVGMLMVDADPESGKIKRCVAVAHENANRKWNSDVVNWLIEKQKQAAKTGPAA